MICYDSVTPSNIPRSAGAVLVYVDGLYKWTPEDIALFPTAHKLYISVENNTAFIADVERGAMTFEEWNPAVQPVCYLSRSDYESVDKSTKPGGKYFPADWTNVPHLVAGDDVVGTQYANTPGYDVSLLLDSYWFGTIVVNKDDDMKFVHVGNQQYVLWSDRTKWNINSASASTDCVTTYGQPGESTQSWVDQFLTTKAL